MAWPIYDPKKRERILETHRALLLRSFANAQPETNPKSSSGLGLVTPDKPIAND